MYIAYKGFMEGAKWQSQKMYSEEEVYELCWGLYSSPNYKSEFKSSYALSVWFEQFKKRE